MITSPIRQALLASFLFLVACGLTLAAPGCGQKSAESLVDEGQASLVAGKAADAAQAFEKADGMLRAAEPSEANKKLRYQARLGLVEARAKMGEGDRAKEEFALLAADDPERVDWKVYQKVARDLQAAGQIDMAAEVIHMAEQAFPDRKEAFKAMIEEIKKAAPPGSPEEAKLRSLGYVK